MYQFENHQGFFVKPKISIWGDLIEIGDGLTGIGDELTGPGAVNCYEILNFQGEHKFMALEDEGSFWCSWIMRCILKKYRPFTIILRDKNDQKILVIKRPFRLIIQQVEIYDPCQKLQGYVIKHFTLFNDYYDVFDNTSSYICSIEGLLSKPRTLVIKQQDVQYGLIKKKLVGNEDIFGIQFPKGASSKIKATLLGAIFLIDFMYFQDSELEFYDE